MTKNIILFSMLLASGFSYSQVGIHTPDPKVTLDITAKNPTGSFTNAEGLLLPRVDRQRAQFMTGVQTSTLVYINNATTGSKAGTAANIDSIGYYYFNGSVWVKWNTVIADTNVYNINGSITADRKVNHEDKTLAITGTVRNIFSVDGTTFSADAATHRIGIGTASPMNRLDLGTVLGSTVSNVSGKKLAVYNNNNSFYGLGVNNGVLQFHAGSGNNDAPKMVLNSSKFLGIGTTAAASNLHVAGSVRISDGTEAEDKVLKTDANGVAAWEDLPDSYILKNFYNSNGALTANRTVTQGNFLLGFAGSVQQNAFSVAGDTFSVDALSHRVGMGTSTPQNLLDMGSNLPTNTNDPESKKIAVSNNTAGTSFYGLGASTDKLLFHANSASDADPAMVLTRNGNLGIGNTDPASSSILDLTSTNKGFLPTRLTQVQRDALAPIVPGLMIYNRDINCMQYWNTLEWVDDCEPGSIATLNCSGATHYGILNVGVAASGVSSAISYTGGNGEYHPAITVTSSVVTGLTARLAAGNFNNGTGTLTFTITGTPSSTGTAYFTIDIGGVKCTFTRKVVTGEVSSLNCSAAVHYGTLTAGVAASGVSSVISYTGGNGGKHDGQTVTSTVVQGLTAKLTAGNFNNGNGTLTYTITGTPQGFGTAYFAINIGGKTCVFTREVKEELPPTPNMADGCSTWNLSGIISGSSYGYVNGINVTASLYSNYGMLVNNSSDPVHTTCGVYFNTGSHCFLGKTQTASTSMTIKFNKLVSNLKVTPYIHRGEGVTVRVKRNGQNVNPTGTLSSLVGCSSSYVSFNTSGNTVSIYNNSGSTGYYDDHYVFNVGGVWFDEVEITLPRNGYNNTAGSGYFLCVGAAK